MAGRFASGGDALRAQEISNGTQPSLLRMAVKPCQDCISLPRAELFGEWLCS
jgi:hypothetical protein